MPSLATVTDLMKCQSVVPLVVWKDINPGKNQELTVLVLELDVSEMGELFALHETPPLKLYSKEDPTATMVRVLARGLTITLGKQRNLFWLHTHWGRDPV